MTLMLLFYLIFNANGTRKSAKRLVVIEDVKYV